MFSTRCLESVEKLPHFLVGSFVYLIALVLITTTAGVRAVGSDENNHSTTAADFEAVAKFQETFCGDCHREKDPPGGFSLDSVSGDTLKTIDAAAWEAMLRRIRTRQMPPSDAERPDENEYEKATSAIGRLLLARFEKFPTIPRVGSIRRLTRFEYQTAVKDLTGVELDISQLLPPDETSQGFDNITVEELSPLALQRYISAAQKISRLAVGAPGDPIGIIVRLPPDRSQEEHVPGLPLGTRGGTVIKRTFPQTGEYEIEIKLSRDRDEKVEGLNRKHDLDLLLDRRRVHRFELKPPNGKNGWNKRDFTHADSHLKTRIRIPAGNHAIGVTFPKTFSSLVEDRRQPFETNYNRHRHPRKTPAVYQVSIVGPFATNKESGSLNQKRLWGNVDLETAGLEEARKLIRRLAERAYRRPVTDSDLELPLRLFEQQATEGGFVSGIELAMSAILVNPNFLFKIETPTTEDFNPAVKSDSQIRKLSQLELASRISFFLWSSVPDDVLRQTATRNQLKDDISGQVARMLDDPRANALVENFATQWLHLRKLDSIRPDLRQFPGFDDNLRTAFQTETKSLFREVLQTNQSILKLIKTDEVFLNQRLATHYQVPGISGSEFRKVKLAGDAKRGGLLRQGSVLMLTSYATRTSPTIRGNWILENLFGTPAPPPPPDIPNLQEKSTINATTVRQRLAQHRLNPACASCHDRMDPLGFALENYDAIGRWRDLDGTFPVDSAGILPDGSKIDSVNELEVAILNRPDIFATAFTEKLMTYALGRPLEAADGPAVRMVVAFAKRDQYKIKSFIEGVILSRPFRMRTEFQ